MSDADRQHTIDTARDALLTTFPDAWAIYSAIDLANMAIRRRPLGVPNESRDSFATLVREGILDPGLGDRLKRMVGFRNLALHQYRELDLDILTSVIKQNLDDLLAFAQGVRADL